MNPRISVERVLEAREKLTQLPGKWSGLTRRHESDIESELSRGSSWQGVMGSRVDEQLDGNIIIYPLSEDNSGRLKNIAKEKVDLLKRRGHLNTSRAVGVIAVEKPAEDENDQAYVLSEADALVRELRNHGIVAGIIESELLDDGNKESSDDNLHNVAGLRQAIDATEATIGPDTEDHAVIVVADSERIVKDFAIPPKVAMAGQLAVLGGLGHNGHLNAQSWEGIVEGH